jgi:ribonuclease Z
MELTLLGTGTPHPNPLRAGPSQHIQLGDSSVLVDCGSGAGRRMVEVGKHPVELDYIFITHMHSDHTIDLAHLLISGWIANRPRPYTIVGPPQTQEFVNRLIHAFEFDIKLRRLHDRVGDEVMTPNVIEVNDGDTVTGADWQATVVEVDHGYVKPALGFVFEQDKSKLVISGDTAPCDAIIKAATGADLLVHELTQGRPANEANYMVDPQGNQLQTQPEIRNRIADSHTAPDQLGLLAQESGVPRLVVSHLPGNFDESWAAGVITSTYKGDFRVGHDLLQLTI